MFVVNNALTSLHTRARLCSLSLCIDSGRRVLHITLFFSLAQSIIPILGQVVAVITGQIHNGDTVLLILRLPHCITTDAT